MTPGRNRGALAYILIAVMLVVSVFVIMPMLSKSGKSTKYSEIIAYFDDYQVTSYTLDLGTGELEFTVKDSKDKKKYTVPNVSLFLDDTDNYRQEYNKQNPDAPLEQDYYKIKDSSWLLTVIPTVVMLGMGIFLIVFMFRQNGGGRYSAFGKANIKAQSQHGKKATFKDVAGADEEKHELEEVVDFLKNPKKYTEIGVPEEWVPVIQKMGYITVEALKKLALGKFFTDLCGFNKKNKLGLKAPSIEEVKKWCEE